MHGRAVAEAPHPALAPLDAAQRQTEWRSDENAISERAQDYDAEDEVIVRGLRGDAHARDRRRRHVGDAVVAAGERSPAVERAPDDVPERDRDQDEIDAARAHRAAVEDREQRSGDQSGRRRHERRIPVADLEDRRGVGGHGEERRLAERVEAGVPEQEIDRQREQAVDVDLGDQGHPELAGNERRDQRGGERGQGKYDPVAAHAQPSLPKMPRGRNSSRIAIGPNSTK